MKKVLGLCHLGQHINKTGYLILQSKQGPEKFAPFYQVEPIIPISNEEMEADSLSVVLKYLCDPFVAERKEICLFDNTTKKELYKLKREYALILIVLLRSDCDEIKIIPLHARKGWHFDTNASEVQIFKLPKTPDEFLNILTGALEIAT